MTALDPALRTLASTQRGMFTTAQARTAGLDPRVLSTLVATGCLLHPGRGLYAVAALVDTEPVAWHAHLCAGAMLMYGDAVLTGTSALVAHGIPTWGADLSHPRLLRPVDRAASMTAFRVRPSRADIGQPVRTDIGPAVSAAHALVQHAIDCGIESSVVSADRALYDGVATVSDLDAAFDRVASWPRSSRARSMLALADGRRESVGESRVAVQAQFAGLSLEPQVEIRDATGRVWARADFRVAGTMVLVEFDGRLKYDGGDPQVLWREKRREDRLRRQGFVVVRVTWADLECPGRVAFLIRQALPRAAA